MVYTWTLSCCNVGLIIRLIALILPFICSFFCLLKAKFVSQFSHELCKPESSNMIYISRMNDCIVGLRLRVMSLFYPFFFPFFVLHVYIKDCLPHLFHGFRNGHFN